ncbi:MAG: hypothetical protein RBR35_15535 [Salinivirgaceae bacterium]|nr:hypothetical protein [Salinivirgaceae bacterium]
MRGFIAQCLELSEPFLTFIGQVFYEWHQAWLVDPFDHRFRVGEIAVGIFTPHT